LLFLLLEGSSVIPWSVSGTSMIRSSALHARSSLASGQFRCRLCILLNILFQPDLGHLTIAGGEDIGNVAADLLEHRFFGHILVGISLKMELTSLPQDIIETDNKYDAPRFKQ